MKKRLLLVITLMLALIANAQTVDVACHIDAPEGSAVRNLLPKPHSAVAKDGVYAGSLDDAEIVMVTDAELGTFDYKLDGFPNEGYRLVVTPEKITITAASDMGVTRARQTLRQLAEGREGVECVEITDFPAFKVRAFMHDIGRSYIEYDELKKEIDLLARFKINVFHWHLTDNQGFRFESKKYPKLNAASSYTRDAGKYYTQAQCTELEQYARERGVMVIPEIDMPGHSQCFTTAMGFNMSSTQGRAVLKNLLDELSAAFPLAPYIHMGADEAGTTAEFVNEMSDYIKNTLGRKVVVWNKISGVNITTQNLPNVDMTWMWATAGSKVTGMANVDCRYNYVNHFDVFADVVGIYKSNVYYAQYGSPEVAGALTALWNDRKSPSDKAIIAQNNLYANALATGERAWIGGGKQYIEKGGVTLPNSGDEYEEFADWERRFLYYKSTWLADEPIPYVKQTNVRWHITDSASISTQATGAGIYLRHTWGGTIPALFPNAAVGQKAYATTYVYSPKTQTVGAQIEFQNYGRSENDKAPDKGKWDRKGSRVFLNDQEILPPTWTNTGKGIGSETDLGNENFPMRNPIAVTLNEGWNKVYLYLPYENASGIRLNKWLFTFVLTDLEGRNAVDGLIYSPNKLMSEEAEMAWARISEIENGVNNTVGDRPGYYPSSTATKINAAITQAKQQLQQTEPDCASILQRVEDAYATFQGSLSTAKIQMPLASTSDETHWYTMQTPLREQLFLSATSSNAVVTGVAEPVDNSLWKFVKRTDGSYDIVNYNGGYVGVTASNNTAISLTASKPSRGWTLSKADALGYLIIKSGTVQFNQTTKSAHSAQLYNWGSGTNTTDVGCKFVLCEVEDPGVPKDSTYEYLGVEPGKKYTITNVQQNGNRYMLYANNGELCVGTNGQTLSAFGPSACFVAEGHEGKVSFRNVDTDDYLVWRGKGTGHNGDKGFTAVYNPTYCDWTIVASNRVDGGYWFHSMRGNGTSPGSLVIMSSTRNFDAYSDAEGWADNYSNVYVFGEVADDDPNFIVLPTAATLTNDRDRQFYDLSGRPVANPTATKVVIQRGRKSVQK